MGMMVYVTCKDEAEARFISMHLLENRLIACANIFPVKSMFWWKGEIAEQPECVVIMKTVRKHFDGIRREVLKTHSADVPCIVGYEMKEGHEDYLAWVHESVK